MTDYRIFFLDAADHIVSAEVIVCACDAEALQVAGTYLNGHPALEVWQRARRVGRVVATPADRITAVAKLGCG